MYIHDNGHELDFTVDNLGPRKVATPYRSSRYVSDNEKTVYRTNLLAGDEHPQAGESDSIKAFELAGARREIYFDPTKTRCGIVTCGGLCPGLNDVIRAITLQLFHSYGIKNIYGFRYGFEGLIPEFGHETIMLTPDLVSDIHQYGGSILSSSRGPQSATEMVDALERLNMQVLFCVGGDGTFRGALALCEEIKKRNLKISVIAVPKTIDNDILYTSRTFGFETAYSVAAEAIRAAHVEAKGAPNGIGLVKLMGRHAGFIAAHAVLASRDANFVLIPEVKFELGGDNGFLAHLYRRMQARDHAVIVVAEGAGQDLFDNDTSSPASRDASGNIKLKDIGTHLRDQIGQYLKIMEVRTNLKYIDPSYLIRSSPATASDSLFAGILGQMAAHAAMSGKTGMFVGYWNNKFTHVPISAAVNGSKRLDPLDDFWQNVIECTGQPRNMTNNGEDPFDSPGELLNEPCIMA